MEKVASHFCLQEALPSLAAKSAFKSMTQTQIGTANVASLAFPPDAPAWISSSTAQRSGRKFRRQRPPRQETEKLPPLPSLHSHYPL